MSCSHAQASATSRSSPTGHAQTAKSSASIKRWPGNGPTGSSTAHTASAPLHCHTGSSTTTERGHTARSEADPRSAAFTTCVGTTPSEQDTQWIDWGSLIGCHCPVEGVFPGGASLQTLEL